MARLFLAFALLIDRAALSHTCNVILIAGTGRAGTTFLVEELTALGAPTGFTEARIKGAQESHAHAGLESIPPMGKTARSGAHRSTASSRVRRSLYDTSSGSTRPTSRPSSSQYARRTAPRIRARLSTN